MRLRGWRERGDKHSHCWLQCRQQQEDRTGSVGWKSLQDGMAEELQTMGWDGNHTQTGWDGLGGMEITHTQVLGWDETD